MKYDESGYSPFEARREARREDRREKRELLSWIAENKRGADAAESALAIATGPTPIATEDTGVFGKWRLYNSDYLPVRTHDHRFCLRKSTPDRPIYDLFNWEPKQGIHYELLIYEDKFGVDGQLPIDYKTPDRASLEPFTLESSYHTANYRGRSIEKKKLSFTITFLGNGYLKLSMRKSLLEGILEHGDSKQGMVEFVGVKDKPRSPIKPAPSPKWSMGGQLGGYNSD